MNYPALLAFICGFCSLSLEILWVRLYGFAKSATPAAFGFVLAAYLIGIALGASGGARACRRATDDAQLWRASVMALLISASLSALLPALFAAFSASGMQNPLIELITIALASSVLAFVFPIAHHLGTHRFAHGQGQRFALVYTANVVGAGLGPLVTGYVLLDAASLQTSFLTIGALQASAAVVLVTATGLKPSRRALVGSGAVLTGILVFATVALDAHELMQSFSPDKRTAKTVIENRHGVITIFPGNASGDDMVYGGNVYDGRTNLSVERNTNGLERPLLMGALHPAPERVLMVGLSVGTWLAIVREFPGVKSVDVVEINPGYIKAAQAYPMQAQALRDPRVHVVIDDARRWLRAHPERKYDLIVMNTTFHWRSNASLLLSAEVFELMRSHMAPGAVLSFNPTGSGDAFFTASRVFQHAYLYSNFVYVADFDFRARKDAPRSRDVYRALQLDGRPMFPPGSSALEGFLQRPFVTVAQDQATRPNRQAEEVTDWNMITEFKYGKRLYYWTDLFYF